MIWLPVRRRRTTLVVLLALTVGLDLWMVVNGHTSANDLRHTGLCQTVACTQPSELYAPARQAVVVDLVLWLLPLALGLALGVGLVAGDTGTARNRLVWTQGVSRTRWYLVSLGAALGGALLVTLVELPFAHWWAGVAWVDLPTALSLGGSRVQPDVFPVSGVVPLAYTGFAVTLGVAAGAVLRRVPWAAVVTVVVYVALAVAMTTSVRPSFAPTGFHMDGTTDSVQYVDWPSPPPWVIGYEYRLIPGASVPTVRLPPDRVAQACAYLGIHPQDVVTCMRRQGVEGGFVTQSPSNYWRLQWSEAALYLGLAVAFGAAGLVAVRRTQD